MNILALTGVNVVPTSITNMPITNTRQKNPILSPDDPFESNFDSTYIYGPIFGRMYYAGLRFNLN